MKKEKLNKNGQTMSQMFKENQEKIFNENLVKIKLKKRKNRNNKIFSTISFVGVLAMLIIGLNSQLNNSIENCVEKGNEYEYCVKGLS